MRNVLLHAALTLALAFAGPASAEADAPPPRRAAMATLQVTAVIAPRCEIATGPAVSVSCAKGVPFALAAATPVVPNAAPNDATLSPSDRDRPPADVLQVYF